MKYICEVCNKQFDTAADAEKCELEHQTEKVKSAERDFAEATINEAVNAFIAKYKCVPKIELAESNAKTAIGDIGAKIDSALGTDSIVGALLDMLFDDEE